MTIQVLGLGAAAMDVVLRCNDLPREDGFAFIHQEDLMPGGSCANTLVALAGLGIQTGLLAKMGEDHYGKFFIEDLAASGVSTEHTLIKPGGVSLHTFITVAADGSKSIFAHFGDSLLELTPDEVHQEMLDGIRVFYTDMLPGPPALTLARWCRDKDIPIIFNLQIEPALHQLCRVSRDMIDEMISLSTFFLSFEAGISELTGVEDAVEAARKINDRYRPQNGVIVTRGRLGSVWVDRPGPVIVPAFNIQAHDSTGAGDAFTAGFIQRYFFHSAGVEKSLEFANACGALKCLQHGPRLQASENDVMAFLNKGDLDHG
jgi:sugar/nucleoside kinase (ribokinase family)